LALVTERHLDHIGGNGFFDARGIPILGHAGIARRPADLAADIDEWNASVPCAVRRARHEAAVPYAGTRLVNPTQLLVDDKEVDLGGLAAHVLLTPGHTPTNVCVWVARDGVLFSGDSLIAGYLPNLEGGGVDDWRAWLRSLDRIEALAPRTVIPGHGPVLHGDDVGAAFARMRAVLATAIAQGVAPTQVR
jgi:cyclase